VNVLFLDQFSDLGGAQLCLLDLVPALQAAGWTVSCAVPGRGRLVEKLHALGGAVHSLPVTHLASGHKSARDSLRFAREAPKLVREIARLAEETRPDLLYVNGPRSLPAAAWVARRTGRPLLFHCHNHLAQRSAAVVAGRALQLCRARVIACCRYVARPLWPYVDPGRLRVIYNGVAAPPGMRAANTDGPRIGIIGRISPEKGQAEFLEAARLVAQKHPAAKFVVCGAPLFSDAAAERYSERLRELASGLPVEFTGWQEDVNAILAQLDVLVVPSLREPGAPRVVIEAFAARVPVVAFVSGGIPEIVSHNETGFLIEPPTSDALAAKLVALLDDPDALRAAAGRAHEAWKEQFTLERYQREALEVIGLTQTRSATGRSI
jgi:glycosyltransferase involved in cell wall biosynthesis